MLKLATEPPSPARAEARRRSPLSPKRKEHRRDACASLIALGVRLSLGVG
jgi:hypothetical protein